MSPTSTGSGRMLRRTVLQSFFIAFGDGGLAGAKALWLGLLAGVANFFGGGDSKGGSLARNKGVGFWEYESMEQLSSSWDSKD
ncbi:uncharacterized protein RSE6_08033 [Rhynchosporium secalis]|uniref:Uncharacterized protein n=1 Tax=Rhynchosporium secalis TaxID=38038 RepID=A0A1E1MEG0_RHYSE|nr:uncharacterized protein RSE6_08033 [Rhynchosporium secalis]